MNLSIRLAVTAPLKAPFTSQLLLALALLPSSSYADNSKQTPGADVIQPNCINELVTERANIERVTDGDTVVLTDQRRVRLIGINSTELNAPNPELRNAAQQATDKLETWLPPGEPVVLYLGDEPHDRHGRVLAHVIRESDALAVAHAMVKIGLAVQSAVAPTTRCTAEFQKLENQAINAQRGLWKIRDLMSISATELNPRKLGFKFVSGTVTSVTSQKRRTKLVLDETFQVFVRPELSKRLSLEALTGQKIEVRGWVRHTKNKPYLWLQHTANLTTLEK